MCVCEHSKKNTQQMSTESPVVVVVSGESTRSRSESGPQMATPRNETLDPALATGSTVSSTATIEAAAVTTGSGSTPGGLGNLTVPSGTTRVSLATAPLLGGPRSERGPHSMNSSAPSGSPTSQMKAKFPPPPPRPMITNIIKMKVEPKVFFANERTFLRWMFAAVLLISMSMSVMAFSPQMQRAGTALVCIGAFFILYAIILYRWRLWRIVSRDGLRFDDRIGPYIFATALLAAAIIVFVDAYQSRITPSFTCLRITPPCAPIQPLASVTDVQLKGNGPGSFVLSDLTSRAATCVPQPKELKVTPVNAKKNQTPTEQILWEDDVTHYCFPMVDNCEALFATYSSATNTFVFNVRNASVLAVAFGKSFGARGATNTSLQGTCNNMVAFGMISMVPASPPVTIGDVNTLLLNQMDLPLPERMPIFAPNALMVMKTTLTTIHQFPGLVVASDTGVLSVVATFANIDDRALQQNPLTLNVEVSLTGGPFTYATLRQAQSALASMTVNQMIVGEVKDEFHK